jgi:hypothetical protein
MDLNNITQEDFQLVMRNTFIENNDACKAYLKAVANPDVNTYKQFVVRSDRSAGDLGVALKGNDGQYRLIGQGVDRCSPFMMKAAAQHMADGFTRQGLPARVQTLAEYASDCIPLFEGLIKQLTPEMV